MIVPVGNVGLHAIQADAPDFARQVLASITEKVPGFIGQIVNEYLDAEATEF